MMMMRDFPSCFGESGVQTADPSAPNAAKNPQNLVICVYKCKLRSSSCLITLTWTRNLMGQGLCVAIDDFANRSICKVDIKPWLFSKRKGCKNIEADSSIVDIYWDFSNAKFGSGPEPVEGYYLAVALNQEMALLVGDMKKEAYKKIDKDPVPSNAIFIAKRENIFGKKSYVAKAQFIDKGQMHDVMIECDTVGMNDPNLVIRIDDKAVMQVRRLRWKFRGNTTILVDGLPVEVYWDVHNWLFGGATGNAVFMFQTCLSAEKMWTSQSVYDPSPLSWTSFKDSRDTQLQGLGFSVILCAWKNE